MSRYKNIIVVLCVFVQASVTAVASSDDRSDVSIQREHEAAVEQYKEGNYDVAAAKYEMLIAQGCHTADLYYNLGNCYYKSNDIARSILNYERALLYAPSMEDARHNLLLANAKKKDKVEEVGEFFLTEKKEALSNCLSSNGWAVMSIVCNLLMLACLLCYFYYRKRLYRQIGFWGAGVFLLLLCLSTEMSRTQKRKFENREYAIVMSPSVTVSSTPDEQGENLVVMHEGVKVKVKSRLGKWVEVRLPNGTIGWIQETDIEII